MIVKLPYGRESAALDLRGLRVRPLVPSAPRGSRDVRGLTARAIDRPLDGPSLGELARGRSSAVVVVPDATRRVQLPEVLPVILDRVVSAGIEPTAITVLVACGTHPRVPDVEIAALVGELPAGATLRQHDSQDDAHLIRVGELRPGCPLRLDREVVECDILVTVGAVRHHYFAGFGGGPKMVFPGVAGYDEIQANHALVLRAGADGSERHPGCEPGNLSGNPVAEEIAHAADLRPPDLAVCLVTGRDRSVAWAGAGPWRTAFVAAVDRARAWYELPAEKFDLVVASGGGEPGDATLIQAHKALDAACRFASPGAEVVFVAELGSGSGSPSMQPFIADPSPSAILDRLAAGYVQYGHTTLRIVELAAQFKVFLKSTLDDDLARRLGFQPIDDLDEVVHRWRAHSGRGRVGVLSDGPVWPRAGRDAS